MADLKLRNYQIELRNKIYQGWNIQNPTQSEYRRQMMFLPTGGGKTILFNFIAKEFIDNGFPVMILAHRKELISQAAASYRKWFGGRADIIKSGHRRERLRMLKIGSVQTVSSRIKVAGGADKLQLPRAPHVIIIDEGHHSTANSYQKIINHYPESLFLYVTATPCRLGGKGFQEVADNLVLGPSVSYLENLWKMSKGKDTGLCPDKILNIHLYSEIKKVKKTKGDYDTKQLNEILNTEEACQAIVDAYIENGENKTMIGYCVKGRSPIDNVRMHDRLAKKFNQAGISAAAIDGESPSELRDSVLRALRLKQIRIVLNMELFTEGFDAPGVDGIILARPTLSLSLYLQMIGRGKRPNGVEKTYNLVLDFVGNTTEHHPPNTPRNWSIKGRPSSKKEKVDPVVKVGDEIMLASELPATHGKPVYYEIISIDQPFRIKSFDENLASREKQMSTYKAAGIGLEEFIKQVKGKPSQLEMRYIAQKAVAGGSKQYKKEWGIEMHKNITFITDLINNAMSLEQLTHAESALKEFLTYKKDGYRKEMPGYQPMKALIKSKLRKLKKVAAKSVENL